MASSFLDDLSLYFYAPRALGFHFLTQKEAYTHPSLFSRSIKTTPLKVSIIISIVGGNWE